MRIAIRRFSLRANNNGVLTGIVSNPADLGEGPMHHLELEKLVETQKQQIDALNRRMDDLRRQFQAENLALSVDWTKLSDLLDERDARIAATNAKLSDLTSEIEALRSAHAAACETAENRSWEDDNLMTALRLAAESIITQLEPKISEGILNDLREQSTVTGDGPLGHEYYLEQIIAGAQTALQELKKAA